MTAALKSASFSWSHVWGSILIIFGPEIVNKYRLYSKMRYKIVSSYLGASKKLIRKNLMVNESLINNS